MPLSESEELELLELEEAETSQAKPQLTSASPRAKTSAAQTALEGFGQTASMGYLPEIQAATEVDPNAELDASLKAQGFTLNQPGYKENVAANYARQAQQAQDNPMSNLVGKGAGIVASGIASSPLMAGKTVAGGSRLARAGQMALQGAKQGAVQGAAYNPGQTQENESFLQPGARLGNAAIGGTLGGLIGGGLGLSKAAGGVRQDIDLVKNPLARNQAAVEQLQQAKSGLNASRLNDEAALEGLIRGKQGSINPEPIRGISSEIDALLPQANSVMPGQPSMEGSKIRQLRQLLGKEAKIPQGVSLDAPAIARNQAAGAQGKVVSDVLKGLDEGVAPLDASLSQNAKLNSIVDRGSLKRPLEAIQPKPGSTRESLMAALDKKAGTNTLQRGKELKNAQGLVMGDIKNLSDIPKEVIKGAKRGGLALADILGNKPAEALSKVPGLNKLSGQDLIKALMELKR